jgi:hypothetical protein
MREDRNQGGQGGAQQKPGQQQQKPGQGGQQGGQQRGPLHGEPDVDPKPPRQS